MPWSCSYTLRLSLVLRLPLVLRPGGVEGRSPEPYRTSRRYRYRCLGFHELPPIDPSRSVRSGNTYPLPDTLHAPSTTLSARRHPRRHDPRLRRKARAGARFGVHWITRTKDRRPPFGLEIEEWCGGITAFVRVLQLKSSNSHTATENDAVSLSSIFANMRHWTSAMRRDRCSARSACKMRTAACG